MNQNETTFVSVTITGILDVSNCRYSSSLMSTSGGSSPDTSPATWTLGIPVLLKAALTNNRNEENDHCSFFTAKKIILRMCTNKSTKMPLMI